ncbi:MAG: tRNA (N6-threonylcarbamoyladenosine(37)-N6)-methyltransferase TrmO [Clostridia bacterium]|nr:tRNA (N6-threonylcarbamoyladenosine(37)-N6)-methyltransferase TrmO [Clostridia bacterium]
MKNELQVIAHIKTDFNTKFGIPRQSGLIDFESYIVFTPEFRNDDALRGIEDFSHLWLIWEFSKAKRDGWSPTVRPPRLGGNKRVGVFATRSPNRPNPIALSCVRLLGVSLDGGRVVLKVAGADLVDGTPIYDVKPYVPVSDRIESPVGGFTEETQKVRLYVDFPQVLLEKIPAEKRDGLIESLSLDPRPGYQDDKDRVYGFVFDGKDIRFKVDGNALTVTEIK